MSTTITVTSAAELNQALSQATGGETILLAAGNYGKLSLNGKQFSSNVTIKSADPNASASFSEAHLNGASNVTFDTIKFDYTYSSGDYHFQNKFSVTNSSNITFQNSNFEGDFASGTGTSADGTGYGTGLMISGSNNIDVINTEFSKWWKGAIALNSDGVSFTGNDVHSIRSDGLVFDNVDNILVENNYIHDFGGAAGAGDHRDMIQVQRANGSGSDNITIRNNVFDMGNGDYTQTIWFGGDGKDLSDPNVIHHNVLIEGNVIYNGHLHGISVYGADGITITKNSVLHVDEKTQTGGIEIPLIFVSNGSSNVAITQNITSQILGHSGQPDWNVGNNVLIKPTEYDQHFTYQATAQTDGYNQYVVIPGSPADLANAGSDLANSITGPYIDWLKNNGYTVISAPSQPNTGTSQPNIGVNPPDTGTSQPDTGTSQPDTGETQTGTETSPPATEQPQTEVEATPPATEQPQTEAEATPPATEQPQTEAEATPPATEQPQTEAEATPPATEQPQTEAEATPPATEQPQTEAEATPPATEQPQTEVEATPPATEQPQTEAETEVEEPVNIAEPEGELMIDISNQDSRGNIGKVLGYSDAEEIAFSVEMTRGGEDTGAERLIWNHSNFGLKLTKKGHLVAKVDNNDGGFRDGYKIKNLDLNDGETHQVTMLVDQNTDRLQVLVDGAVVLDETETDFDFAGGRERDWYVGDSVETFGIGDDADFLDTSSNPYPDLFA